MLPGAVRDQNLMWEKLHQDVVAHHERAICEWTSNHNPSAPEATSSDGGPEHDDSTTGTFLRLCRIVVRRIQATFVVARRFCFLLRGVTSTSRQREVTHLLLRHLQESSQRSNFAFAVTLLAIQGPLLGFGPLRDETRDKEE